MYIEEFGIRADTYGYEGSVEELSVVVHEEQLALLVGIPFLARKVEEPRPLREVLHSVGFVGQARLITVLKEGKESLQPIHASSNRRRLMRGVFLFFSSILRLLFPLWNISKAHEVHIYI